MKVKVVISTIVAALLTGVGIIAAVAHTKKKHSISH